MKKPKSQTINLHPLEEGQIIIAGYICINGNVYESSNLLTDMTQAKQQASSNIMDILGALDDLRDSNA